jgi:hypothetical protein
MYTYRLSIYIVRALWAVDEVFLFIVYLTTFSVYLTTVYLTSVLSCTPGIII